MYILFFSLYKGDESTSLKSTVARISAAVLYPSLHPNCQFVVVVFTRYLDSASLLQFSVTLTYRDSWLTNFPVSNTK
jgi:hypothetical protein